MTIDATSGSPFFPSYAPFQTWGLGQQHGVTSPAVAYDPRQADAFEQGYSSMDPNQMMLMAAIYQQLIAELIQLLVMWALTQQKEQNPAQSRDLGNMDTGAFSGQQRGSWDPSPTNTSGSTMPNSSGTYEPGKVYPPGSAEARDLFREAARLAGVPEEWADSPGLHNILRKESGGVVGIPNYTYGGRKSDRSQWSSIHQELKNGQITARSSATGLGQLLLSNVDAYYPSGRAGIGNPVEEAAGMLAYIKDRYGNPEEAWRLYGTRHEGY